MGQEISTQEEWDRPTIGVPERHKGFKNATGENNCFLNVSLQALWHLRAFREPIKEHLAQFDHLPPDDDSVLDCVYSLFTHYQYADASELATTSVRELLARKYTSIDRFQLGEMDDANEALEAILRMIHMDQYRKIHPHTSSTMEAKTSGVDDDDQCHGCIAHRVFGSSVVEQSFCEKCKATSEPTVVDLMLHPLYATELIEAAPIAKHSDKFEKLLSHCFRTQPKSCPNNTDEHPERDCAGPAHSRRYFLSTPTVFALSIVWSTTQGKRGDIDKILSTISCELDLSKVFDIVPAGGGAEIPSAADTHRFRRRLRARRASRELQGHVRDRYRFRGMVLYYGKHYVAMFQSNSTGNWLLFDDARIRSLGNWKQAKDYCLQGTYQPTLLLYERMSLGDEATISPIQAPTGAGGQDFWVFPKLHDSMAPPPLPQQTPQMMELRRTESPDLQDFQVVTADLLDEEHKPSAPIFAADETKSGHDESWVELEDEKPQVGDTPPDHYITDEPEVILRAKPGPHHAVQYYVEIEPDILDGRPVLGLRIACDAEGYIFVTDYAPHPKTNELLPIHKRVELMDRLLEANGQSLIGCTVDDAVRILTSRTDTVSLLLQSSYKTVATWFCKACGHHNHVTDPPPTIPILDIPVVCSGCNKTSLLFLASPR